MFKFPKIYLRIPDKIKYIFAGGLCLVLFLTAITAGLSLFSHLQQKEDLNNKKSTILSQIQVWQEIVGKYKDYRDGYLTLSILEYRLGDNDKARFYLQKTLSIDPNFEKARDLEKILRFY
ncbi:MAG: hypothetical protein Q7R31_01970 [Candidatus Levybacteria bacterium]|nr:hypothetical protein [Candidatus Levybacteria bacterium]